MAWLNTAPKDKAGKSGKTRLQKINDDDGQPTYPPLSGHDYLIGYLFDAGPAMSGGMGNAQLSHGEIRAWQDNTGIELTPWEARTLRTLSGEYLASAQDAEDAQCKPPYSESVDAKNLHNIEVQSKLDMFLS